MFNIKRLKSVYNDLQPEGLAKANIQPGWLYVHTQIINNENKTTFVSYIKNVCRLFQASSVQFSVFAPRFLLYYIKLDIIKISTEIRT